MSKSTNRHSNSSQSVPCASPSSPKWFDSNCHITESSSGTRLFIDHRFASFIFRELNFRCWYRPLNYFNSEYFPIYGILTLNLHAKFCTMRIFPLYGIGSADSRNTSAVVVALFPGLDRSWGASGKRWNRSTEVKRKAAYQCEVPLIISWRFNPAKCAR